MQKCVQVCYKKMFSDNIKLVPVVFSSLKYLVQLKETDMLIQFRNFLFRTQAKLNISNL